MKTIIIYSLSTCLWCKKTKKYFEDRKIQFEVLEYDKQDEARQAAMMAEMRAAGYTGSFPFIKIGKHCTQGYDPQEFETLLNNK